MVLKSEEEELYLAELDLHQDVRVPSSPTCRPASSPALPDWGLGGGAVRGRSTTNTAKINQVYSHLKYIL